MTTGKKRAAITAEDIHRAAAYLREEGVALAQARGEGPESPGERRHAEALALLEHAALTRTAAQALTSSRRQDWGTPPEVLDLVRALGPIGLDPCSGVNSQTQARVSYALPQDGLALPWREVLRAGEVVYVNPPFDRVDRWAARCAQEGEAGAPVVLLCRAAPGAKWWQEALRSAACALVWRGRLRFWADGKPGDAPTFDVSLFFWGFTPSEVGRVFGGRGELLTREQIHSR